MPELRVHVFCSILAPTVALLFFGWHATRTSVQRMFLLFGVSALFLYSGIGAAYDSVSPTYAWAYVLFLAAFVGAFAITISASEGISNRFARRVQPAVSGFVTSPVLVRATIAVFMLSSATPLIYPTFQLHRLISPPSPDLTSVFMLRFSDQNVTLVSRLVEYVALLSTPFYLVALYNWRKRVGFLVAGILLPLYFDYCARAYVGRGLMAMAVGLCFLVLWQANARMRKYLLITGIIAFPFICRGLYEYSSIRLGAGPQDVTWLHAAELLLRSETEFPLDSGFIIESNARADLRGYFLWVITLPIPKVITGEIEGARINYEISEIILNREMGTRGAYVRLTGLVTESIYIYGLNLFWIHGLFIGFAMAVVCRIQESCKQFFLLTISFVLLFSYFANRGGIATLLPRLLNENLLFFSWLAYLCFRPLQRSMESSQRAPLIFAQRAQFARDAVKRSAGRPVLNKGTVICNTEKRRL